MSCSARVVQILALVTYNLSTEEVSMPLRKGSSKQVIGGNIHELERAGHKHTQAVAIAMQQAYGKKKKGIRIAAVRRTEK